MSITLPPLPEPTIDDLMAVFRSHARIPPGLIYTSWRDGIDIDEPSPDAIELAQRLIEADRAAVLRAVADWLEAGMLEDESPEGWRPTNELYTAADAISAATPPRTL